MDLVFPELDKSFYYIFANPRNEELAVTSAQDILRNMLIPKGYEEREMLVVVDRLVPIEMMLVAYENGVIGEIEVQLEAQSERDYLH